VRFSDRTQLCICNIPTVIQNYGFYQLLQVLWLFKSDGAVSVFADCADFSDAMKDTLLQTLEYLVSDTLDGEKYK
jgi:hypothetical protein